MRSSTILATLLSACAVSGLKILMNNDDGFAAANIRETYRLLKDSGHTVVMVAPVDNESGQAGRSVFTNSATLQVPSEYNLIPAGAPSLGQDPNDPDIWYYNGTPAACTFVALDYVLPNYYNNMSIDLFVAGPNFGGNLGPFLYTLSGTMGATYAAVYRNLPAIAFSGGNLGQRSYLQLNQTTVTGYPDPATVQAQLAVSLVNQLAKKTKKNARVMPLGYGITVNTPAISSAVDSSCLKPPFIQTRLTGGAFADLAAYNATTGTFHYENLYADGLNTYINGNPTLPGETDVVDGGCYSSVSVFSVDYDAPRGSPQGKLRKNLEPLVLYEDGGKASENVRKRYLERRDAWKFE